MLIVMKFGGTSVGDGDRIRQAAELVAAEHARGHTVVVVSSAMSGVTDALVGAAREAARGDANNLFETKRALLKRHREAIERAVQNAIARIELSDQIQAALDEFENLGRAVHVLGELTPRALDAMAAFGERLIVPILRECLQELGLEAWVVDATRLIVTDEHFGAANPEADETKRQTELQLVPALRRRAVPVITGFIGATRSGQVTTLGRGGSDYSAALLGHALEADEVWIWTDVDGVMSADPRVVKDARTLPEVSYAEAAELAYFGAKVIHPKTILPAVEKNIPVRILNTFNPAHPGTRVVRETKTNGEAVKAISAIHKLSMLTVEGRGMLGVPGVAGRVFSTVARANINVLMISQSSSEQNICFVVESAMARKAVELLEEEFTLERLQKNIEQVSAQDSIAILAVVGAGLRLTPGIAAKVFGALGAKAINILALAQGSSEYNLSLVVDERDADEAVRSIHSAFY
jgi:aspartate kinase